MKHLVVMSGGLDSTTTLFRVLRNEAVRDPEDGYVTNIKALGFDYGQRHKKELVQARRICNQIGVEYEVVNITSITAFLAPSGSSLVSDSDVPEGHYAEENMKSTVVPNRNMIMASIAAGHAVAIGADALWMGVHAGDHFIYPDCRPEFFEVLNAAVCIGNEGFGPIADIEPGVGLQHYIRTPYINSTKADIAYDAVTYEVPIGDTWSCYKGGTIHCGKCGTCVERLEALTEAAERHHKLISAVDTTIYEDSAYWREALKRETV